MLIRSGWPESRVALLFRPLGLLALWMALLFPSSSVASCLSDAEPNDEPASAQNLEATCVIGELGPDDQDLFLWNPPGERAQLWVLELEGIPNQRTIVEIRTATPKGEGITAGSRIFSLDLQGARSLATEPLLIAPGRYLLGVSSSGEGGYRFDLREAGQLPPPVEADASGAEPRALSGAFALSGDLAESSHVFRWQPPAENAQRLWRLSVRTALGRGVKLMVRDGEGRLLAERRPGDAGEMVLADLSSAAGELVVELTRADRGPAPYLLQAEADDPGERRDGHELEPNDTLDAAFRLDQGLTVRGRLVGHETDTFRFEVEGEPRLWRAQVLARDRPVETLRHYDGGGSGGAMVKASGERRARLDNLLLLPGEHSLSIEGEDTGYLLKIVAIGPADSEAGRKAALQVADDVAIPGVRPPGLSEYEPNDLPDRAGRLRFGSPRVGLLTDPRDTDQYRFHLAAEQPVRVRVQPPPEGEVVFDVTGGERSNSASPGAVALFEGWLRPGDHWVSLRPQQAFEGFYQIELEPLDPFLTPRAAAREPEVARETGSGGPRVAIGIKGRADAVAAYWGESQVLDLGLWVQNLLPSRQTLRFEAATSDVGWKARILRQVADLGPAQATAIPLQVEVLPDARDDQPVLLTVAARSESGGVEARSVELLSACGAEPMAAGRSWPLPDRFLGGLNVAATALGADPEGDDRFVAELFDGLVVPLRDRPRFESGQTITIDLAGEEPVLLVGTLLHPLGRSIQGSTEQLAEFAVSLSLDGRRFETVLEGRLQPLLQEQVFRFEEPVEARHARLELKNSHGGGADITLGEWKVVAHPEALPIRQPRNLARPVLGGYVVWSDPLIETEEFGPVNGIAGNGHPVLSAAAERPFATTLSDQSEASWVVAFHHNRAARITGLEWIASESRNHRAQSFDSIEIAVSMSGPLGPWEPLASWEPGRAERLTLPEPFWARFVRFTARGLQPETDYRYPERLGIFEQEVDSDYRSILGEWGFYSRRAGFEAGLRLSEAPPLAEAVDNDSRQSAQSLPAGREAHGRVLVEEDVDWYRLEVPEGHNALRVTLRGDPAVAVSWELEDSRGRPVPAAIERSPEQVTLLAEVAHGEHYLRLEEPPRSVVLSWDTSASIGPYRDFIRAAATEFSRAVKPGREIVNLLPFDKPPRFLLPEWSGEPALVMEGLNGHNEAKAFSSNAELALLTASAALEKRRGARAILLLTDAFSNGYSLTPDLWNSFSEVSPQVFSMHTPSIEHSSAGSAASQDLMQSWAEAGGGFYDAARSLGHFDVGFSRASCYLRRPKSYRVLYDTGFEQPAGPGSIEVVAGARRPSGVARPEAIEVIFDASGSMYRRVGDQLRIEIARQVLGELVHQMLPPGTPFALRVFGNRKARACRTDLEVPLGPLDATALERVLDAIEPQPYSGTPIAESLEQVESDLSSASAGRRVVLITDGEESCDGDVEAAIEGLRRRGFDVELNIVGFDVDAIDREAARERFRRWAELGGGRYFDASSAAELEESLTAAVSRSFEVVGGDGEVVATGTVGGGPVEVPAGVYEVRVGGSIAEVFEGVGVTGEQRTVLKLGEEG